MKTPVTVLLVLASTFAASAQDRRIVPITVARKQALVIGNAAYARAPLKNPVNDAASMESTLRKLGFEVQTLRNLDLPHMEAAIDEFTANLAAGSLALFYYSGHGVQVNSLNYLLPVDFAATSEADVKYKAYPATRVQEKMEESRARLRVLVLDACRNNPFRYKRDAAGGLAAMPVSAEGTLIAFATGDNNAADDNAADANGLYTKYLMPALLTPGLQLRETFQKAKEDVFAASRRTQNPSIYENVVGTFYLVSPPAGVPATARLDAAAETWALIKDSHSPEDFEAFANAYPNSDLAPGARIRAAQLRRANAPARPPAVAATLPPGQNTAGSTKVNPKDGLTYVWIPPGTFTMGCSPGDAECDEDEKPPHQVTITKGFWTGQTEVTQEAFQRVTGKNQSYFKGARLPVENVSWNDAKAYCEAVGMRLPTEAEWEYAARGGSTAARYGVVDAVAWYAGNSDKKTHEVAQKQANGFGPYDMLGNVWEWVADWYDEKYYGQSPATDPQGPASGRYRELRGGAWDYGGRGARVSYRQRYVPLERGYYVGVRCAGE